MCRKSVFVLYTGGTIGMRRGRHGLTPSANFVYELEEMVQSSASANRHRCSVACLEPIIDSADVTPERWFSLAQRLWSARDAHDGFVVLHGTDTLAYTAGALSFLLLGFGKPVVLTGARVPIFLSGSDGPSNLEGALICAIRDEIREVCVFFGDRLMRGNRTRKVGSHVRNSFESPRWPALGHIRQGLELRADALLRPTCPLAQPRMLGRTGVSIGLIKLYPGIRSELITMAGQTHPEGIVVEMYGSGTGPSQDTAILRAIEQLAARDTPVVAVSQCFSGEIDLASYAAGRAFSDIGVIEGHDLTSEAALTKLAYLQCLGLSTGEIPSTMGSSLAGELSTPAAARFADDFRL